MRSATFRDRLGTGESFNGKFRDECWMLKWFRNRLEAEVGIDRWRGSTTKCGPT
jgi:putative transposase